MTFGIVGSMGDWTGTCSWILLTFRFFIRKRESTIEWQYAIWHWGGPLPRCILHKQWGTWKILNQRTTHVTLSPVVSSDSIHILLHGLSLSVETIQKTTRGLTSEMAVFREGWERAYNSNTGTLHCTDSCDAQKIFEPCKLLQNIPRSIFQVPHNLPQRVFQQSPEAEEPVSRKWNVIDPAQNWCCFLIFR